MVETDKLLELICINGQYKHVQLLYDFEIHNHHRCHIYLIDLFIVRVRTMLNVKWQERTTTTEILEVSWPISVETMLVGDICGDAMTERYPSIFGMASFIA